MIINTQVFMYNKHAKMRLIYAQRNVDIAIRNCSVYKSK